MTAEDDTPVAILVELDVLVRMTVSDMLIDAGFRTVEASDAQGALELLTAHDGVRLLITTCGLPGGADGIGLAHFARQQRPSLGIIVTTPDGRLEADVLPVGARIVRKPFGYDDLIREVEDILAQEDAASSAPLMLQGLPSTHVGLGNAAGTSEIAASVSGPDKS